MKRLFAFALLGLVLFTGCSDEPYIPTQQAQENAAGDAYVVCDSNGHCECRTIGDAKCSPEPEVR